MRFRSGYARKGENSFSIATLTILSLLLFRVWREGPAAKLAWASAGAAKVLGRFAGCPNRRQPMIRRRGSLR